MAGKIRTNGSDGKPDEGPHGRLHAKEREAATQLDVRFFVDAVFHDVSYTLRRSLDRKRRVVTWQSIAGDLKVARGSWAVEALADPAVSRVSYTSFVDVGYFVPTGMVRDVALGKVTQMAQRVRTACAGPLAR